MAYTTIDDPSAHFQTLIYTGNNTSRSLTNTGNSDLQPDLIWQKGRDIVSDHGLIDSTRGIRQVLWGNQTNAEVTSNSGADITAFNSDGFSVGTSHQIDSNSNTKLLVAWQWKANGGTTTTNDASATSIGSQDSVYQANTTAGFSIVTWSGANAVATMAHGLGAVPHVIILKSRTATENWGVYHHKNTSAPETDYLKLNTTDATTDSTSVTNDTAPTSTLFTVGDSGIANEVGNTYVGYLFSEIQGYSKFGSYTGNGNADGPFVYLGFKPKYFLLKNTAATQNWYVFDTARDTYNPSNSAMQASSNAAQETGYAMDFLSNGFKIRHNDGAWNGSGNAFIYMAFAEHPFVSSKGVPCTAR